ncbi:hypothetical protein [Nocardia sp. NPDC052566]|uniref:hypothetical protein n=1 Tax=Nocardia sp. NPDC052566 TaxID=3364330 RepID=UPI0037C933D7
MTSLPDVTPRDRARARRCGLGVIMLAVLGLAGVILGCLLPQGVSTEGAPLSGLSEIARMPITAAAPAPDVPRAIEGSPSCRKGPNDAATPTLPAAAQRDNTQQLPAALRAKGLGTDQVFWSLSADEGHTGSPHPVPAPHLTTVLRI